MIEPNNDTLAEMLEGTRDALEKALGKIAKLEAENGALASRVLIYAYRADEAASLLRKITACEGGSWHPERYAKERAILLEEAHALIESSKRRLP